ncbi:MAG: hypothetical protein CFH41_00114 [Alphaproteobacteria bacterium MarineAlpha11_Bin1]|nr:MAG: hypothetical protein CFH41_00114 [Alphaproteobacteria bacterium MarineAlpha11_Bin1]|tara:strand:- start:2076 stop:3173 length:1098 start_codon:yes stop_codon:yes gene_type:complete
MKRLETFIRERIEADGPIPVYEYMALALGHTNLGYYKKGDPIGADGDFITSPEISQVFGELIGLWAAVTWQQMSCPDKIILIECGPGRGTLMKDLLRATTSVPMFEKAIEIHLVETSEFLMHRQAETLSGQHPIWHKTIETIPPGPTILIANEFIDSLPIRQVTKVQNGWAERCVGSLGNTLQFMPGTICQDPLNLPKDALPGEVYEFRPAAVTFINKLSKRLAAQPGAALIIDYGYKHQAPGDTLQAVREHQFADPLSDPGEVDLTAHVDFGALSARASDCGSQVFGPIDQASFLRSLGIIERTAALFKNATPEQAERLYSATQRLIDPNAMGSLFNAMIITDSEAPAPAGFEIYSTENTSNVD